MPSPGGIGVLTNSGRTINLLTNANGATISGGAGAAVTTSRGTGGAGVSNSGTITTLTNSGAISGGAGGGPHHASRIGLRLPSCLPRDARDRIGVSQFKIFATAILGRKSRDFERRHEVSNVAPRKPAIDPKRTSRILPGTSQLGGDRSVNKRTAMAKVRQQTHVPEFG